ncbi:MAG: serine/threonine protein phosphatase PrpC [Planctomycetota bacterium]|jgi:serine/threonine protein phosphatase PrpC
MKARGFGSTDVGRERESNEDAFLLDDDLGIYAVSDGMGGHAAGEEAARLAIEAVRESITIAGQRIESRDLDHSVLRRLATDAMRAAGARVYERATTVPELSGMGCTLTLLLTSGSRAVMGHVGDTRLYLHREGSTWQLSSDHTLAADLVRRGEITEGDAKEHPYANALTRALGSQESVDPETLMLDVLPDDVFLLCSDGLSQYLDGPAELSTSLGSDDLSSVPGELVAKANEKGGRDNITAVVVRVVPGDQEQDAVLSRDVRIGLKALRQVPVLGATRFADLLRMFNLAEVQTHERGAIIAGAQDRMHALYIPLVGELDIFRSDGSSFRIQRGQAIGLTSLLVPRRWNVRVEAHSEARLLSIDGRAFRELARRRPWMGVRIFSALAEELERELPDLVKYGESPSGNTTPWWSPGRWFRGSAR